jgi:sulfatase maturation enzyme AslB (radical SAM superfamily)
MCPRNFYGMKHNAGYEVTNMTLENFKKIFNEQFVSKLKNVKFNGNLGDFNMNPEAVEIVEYLRHNNKNMYIEINTNGHSRNSDFWRKLADSDPVVLFALDGMEDTHSLHRIGTTFSRVIQNAKTFIDAGGRATWKMIVFDHNKHQVSRCSKLAKKMNFYNFRLANDGRNNAFVFNNDGSHSHTIGKPPHRKPLDASELLRWKAAHDWQAEAKEKKQIVCEALRDKKIFMSSTGDIFPCCWLGFSPGKYDDALYHGNEQLKKLMKKSENNGVTHGLEKAVTWFSLVQESWRKKTIKEGRLYRCDLHCGKN